MKFGVLACLLELKRHYSHGNNKQCKTSHIYLSASFRSITPLVVISHGKQRQRQTFYSLLEDHYCLRIIPELRNKSKHACSYGWLVLEDRDADDCVLFNHVSMERIQLPPMDSLDHDICVLSAPPSSPDCQVVFIDSSSNLSLLFCKPGDIEFDEQKLEIGGSILSCATALGSKIYGLQCSSRCLMVLDFSSPRPRFRPMLAGALSTPLPGINYLDYYLIESCGDILFVSKMYLGLSGRSEVLGFSVFRADFFDKSWVEVKSIASTQFFLVQLGASLVLQHQNQEFKETSSTTQ